MINLTKRRTLLKVLMSSIAHVFSPLSSRICNNIKKKYIKIIMFFNNLILINVGTIIGLYSVICVAKFFFLFINKYLPL